MEEVMAAVFSGRTRIAAAIIGVGLVLLLVGAAVGAAGDAIILGAPNDAGDADTSLTTSTTGTALFVTQTGTGAAIRGSTAAGRGVAGSFTSQFGSAVAAIVGNPNGYALFASSEGAIPGTGAAIRANGKLNAGIIATSDRRNAIGAYVTTCEGVVPPCGGHGVDARGFGFAGAVYGDGSTSLAGLWASGGRLAGVYSTVTGPEVAGVHAESIAGTAVVGIGANGGKRQDLADAGGEFLGTYGVIGQTDAPYGAGVFGTTTNESGYAMYSDGNAYVDGDLGLSGVCTGCTTAVVAVNGSTGAIRQGDAVVALGVRTAGDGRLVVVVGPAKRGDRVLGIADRALTLSPESATVDGASHTIKVAGEGDVTLRSPQSTITPASRTWSLGAVSTAPGGNLRVITSGTFAYNPATAPGLAAGDQLAVGSAVGRLTRAAPSAARGTIAGTFLGTLSDGRVVVLVNPD
jgi:hypothetical protein